MQVNIKHPGEVFQPDATAFEAQDVEQKEPGKSSGNKRGQNLADREGGEPWTRLRASFKPKWDFSLVYSVRYH